MVGKVDITISDSVKHAGEVTGLVFRNDYLYSSGADGLVKIWSKELELIKDLPAHESHIYTLAVNERGCLYTSGCDGTVRSFQNPLQSNAYEIIYENDYDAIITIQCYENGIMFTGDDKGIVSHFIDDRIHLQYNIVEEVKSLAVNKNLLYTARDMDVVVTDLTPTGRYMTKGIIPGRAPLLLIGPTENGVHKYLAFTTRDGKGIAVARNGGQYPVIWTKDNAHDLIINAICGTPDRLYTAGYDGKVKKWIELENGAQNSGEVATGVCINHLCNGIENTVYIGDNDGVIKRAHFSSAAA